MSESLNSHSSNESGFRSRERDRIKRQQARKKILQNYKNLTNQQQTHNKISEIQQTEKIQSNQRRYLRIQEQAQLYKNQEYHQKKAQQNFQDDDLDMFGDESINEIKQKQARKQINGNPLIDFEHTDDQGYYIAIQGSVIGNGKYKILQKLGKGMFGSVVKALKVKDPTIPQPSAKQSQEVFAIKIIRKNQLMEQSGQKEYQLLTKIKNPKYLMKVFDYFHQHGHLCIVCELMGQDLRSYVKKHQSQINLDTLRTYSIQMFMALHQLNKNKIIHADIKPDNFLFTLDHKKIKLCDFGTSYYVNQHTSQIEYLVARYYRAPQIMLGYQTVPELRYHIDTWAVGCSLFELYTGEFLFNGSNNNQMLKQIMETKGKFSLKVLKNSKLLQKHFDSQYNFLYQTYDKEMKKNVEKKLQITITQQRELLNRLRKHFRDSDENKKLINFRDFLEKCLTTNPKDRLQPKEAFLHPFLNYQVKLD